ncbi:hypothetical protein ORG27_12230 [Stenotrophomonas lactitubi]|uniref:hypothetical protein n=1 Tax=Stenotrophomonas lactitubi TaxID=2045214 RepID=UPI00224897F6|nr:hypothetical protein [Stenotrophomonas lactitubi]MCX2894344.1 hypothetical protein [Stenotrophomonas lactitubi]
MAIWDQREALYAAAKEQEAREAAKQTKETALAPAGYSQVLPDVEEARRWLNG